MMVLVFGVHGLTIVKDVKTNGDEVDPEETNWREKDPNKPTEDRRSNGLIDCE